MNKLKQQNKSYSNKKTWRKLIWAKCGLNKAQLLYILTILYQSLNIEDESLRNISKKTSHKKECLSSIDQSKKLLFWKVCLKHIEN